MNPLLAVLLRLPLHGLGAFVALLPRSWEMSLGGFLGRIALHLDPKRRRIAEDNITRCLDDLTPRRRAEILRENYEHYGRLVLELAHMFAPIPGHFRRYAQRVTVVEGEKNWVRANARGNGVIFCATHLANWELVASAAALAGWPVTIVTRHLKPEWLHRWMRRTRLSVGVHAAYQPRTIPIVMKTLRDGGGAVFVLDQYMPPPMGSPLRFFGYKVDTLSAVAPLARRTGAAILPVKQRRERDGTVRLIIEPELTLASEDQATNQELCWLQESWARENPGQWLWGHRRFKNVDWNDREAQFSRQGQAK